MNKRDPLFDKLALLDRLEELREDMLELGITTLAELDARIASLDAEISDEEDEGPDDDGPV